MYELIEQLADKIASKYSLDKDSLLNKNPRFGYITMGSGLIEFDKNTHLSRCISKDEKIVNVFEAIQTLLSNIH